MTLPLETSMKQVIARDRCWTQKASLTSLVSDREWPCYAVAHTLVHGMLCQLCLSGVVQEVQNLMALPGQVHAMIQGGIPWWQIMYTGLMSTDAVLMIEVGPFG